MTDSCPPIRRRALDSASLAEAITATLDNEWLNERASAVGQQLRERDPLLPKNQKALLEQVLGT